MTSIEFNRRSPINKYHGTMAYRSKSVPGEKGIVKVTINLTRRAQASTDGHSLNATDERSVREEQHAQLPSALHQQEQMRGQEHEYRQA